MEIVEMVFITPRVLYFSAFHYNLLLLLLKAVKKIMIGNPKKFDEETSL